MCIAPNLATICNDSYSSLRINIESCESDKRKESEGRKERNESEKETVSLFIHTSCTNNSQKFGFLF